MKTIKRFIARIALFMFHDYCFKHMTPHVYGEDLGAWNYCRECKFDWKYKYVWKLERIDRAKARWLSWL